MVIFLVMISIFILISIFYFFSMWTLFEKCGEKGWMALIPFLNVYIMFKICKMEMKWFFAYLILVMTVSWVDLPETGEIEMSTGLMVAVLFAVVGLFAISVKQSLALAEVFNKDKSFAWGLLLLPLVFIPLLAFGQSKYRK